MYFTYVLLLRALSRSGPQLVRTLDATAGERETRDRLEQLVRVADGCPSTFDETSMFSGGKEAEVRSPLSLSRGPRRRPTGS